MTVLPDLTIITNTSERAVTSPELKRAVTNAVVQAEARQIQKLVQEQRELELRRQRERQSLVDKILFHHRRGMSRGQLERNWGVDAVRAAFDALPPDQRPDMAVAC